MSTPDLTIRSFVIVLYRPDDTELASFQVPVSVASPFANRLLGHLGDLAGAPAEPWYRLTPCYSTDPLPERPAWPDGPTSVCGVGYDPAALPPPAVLLHPDALVHGFIVQLMDLQRELFRGAYSVDDLFLHGAHCLLQRALRDDGQADDRSYYYAVLPSPEAVQAVVHDLLPEEAYDVEGLFPLPPRARERPRVRFRRLPEPQLAVRDPASFGPRLTVGRGDRAAGRVLMPERVYESLRRGLTLRNDAEEGGYALGNVYRLPDAPADEDASGFRWLVEVTDLLMAEDTVGSPLRLLFTGNTWSKANRRRERDFAGRKLVGWFHTHLFPAADDFGLSGLDQEMHAWYLPRPWQVAILLNLEPDGGRTVRCYQRGPARELAETPFEVF